MALLDILNPIKSVADSIGGIIDNLHTSAEEKGTLSNALAQIQIEFVQVLVGLQLKVIEYESKLVDAKASVIIAEAQAESWITRSWRPIVMLGLSGAAILPYIGRVFGADMPEPSEELWTVIKIGLGGYIGGRSMEKIFPKVVEVIRETRTVPSVK